MFKKIFVIFILINLFVPQISLAAPPTNYNKELASDVALRGSIFAIDATGLYAHYENEQIRISSDDHQIITLKFKLTSLGARLKGFDGLNVGITHIADDGSISHYVDTLKADGQGFAYGTFEFSEVIISGLTGITTFNEVGLSGNHTKTFNDANVSYIDFNITNHDSPASYIIGTTNYAHRRLLTLNQTIESLIDLQVKKTQSWNSNMKPDMRDNTYTYYENNTKISFWDESVTNNTSKMSWIKVPATSTTNTTKIWFYYGNSSVVSSSNGNSTFVQYHETATTDYLDSLSITSSNIIYESYLKVTSATHNNLIGLSNSANAADDGMFFQLYNIGDLRRGINENEDISSTVSEEPDVPIDTYVNLKITYDDAIIRYYIDDNEISSGSTEFFPNENLGLFLWNPSGTLIQDWSFVRKYISVPPTWAEDGEEQTPTSDLNITTSVTGDINTTNYTTDIPQTHILTPSSNIAEIVFNTTSSNWDYTAVLYWTNDIILTETAESGEYHANITATEPLNLDSGRINFTIDNSTLLNSDFNNFIQISTNDSNFNESESNLSLPDISLFTNAVIGTYFYDLQYDYFNSPQNLTATPTTNSVLLNWSNVSNADKYSIYELEEGIPWFDTQPILDGIIDSVYLELSHHFHINSPNPVNNDDFDVLYMGRDSEFVYLSGTAIDNDGLTLDDYARLYTDFTKDGLTIDDLMYQIRENGATSCNEWTGTQWLSCGSSGVTGATTGAGTNSIVYELRVPVSELPANWVNGTDVRMLLEREDTFQNPNVFSYYPESNINNTYPELWQDIKLSNTTEYEFISNTTNNFYDAIGLIPFSWYRFGVSAWNGSQETSLSIVNVTTLDTLKYNVSGYVLDFDTGFGLSSASVWIQNGFVLATTSTNSTGYYELENIHNGTYRIFADDSLYATNNTSYFVISGSDIINKNVTLEHLPVYEVSGYVYNTTGVGMSNATVTINGFTNLTNSTGFYTLEGLMNGTYTGTASLNGYTSNEITIIVFGSDVINQNIILYVVEKLTSYIIYFILIISPTLIFVGNRMKIIGMIFVLTTYILFIFSSGWTPGELYVFAAGVLFGFANIFNEDRLKYN